MPVFLLVRFPYFISVTVTKSDDYQFLHTKLGTDGSLCVSLYLDLIKDHYNLSAQWRPGCNKVRSGTGGREESFERVGQKKMNC